MNRLNISWPLLSARRALSMTASQNNENRRSENRIPIRPTTEPVKPELTPEPMMNTGSVPFGWEKSPGTPKNDSNKRGQTKEHPPSLPKLPPGRFLRPIKKDLAVNVRNIAKNESSTSRDEDHHRDDDSDEAYMDALDTLSRGETSFYNCSVSGVSGFGPNVITPGTRTGDPKMRDFMMRRFLPAAKAMASDAPQHSVKKNVFKEKPREVKKRVNTDDKKGQLRYGPNFLQDVPDKKESEEDKEDESDSDHTEHEIKSSKFCGLIPRGFCSANPVRGMCMKTKIPMSPANKTHPNSSSVSSISGSEIEPARIATHKHRALDSALKKLCTETKNIEGSNLNNHLQGPGISVTVSGLSQSTVSEQSPSSSNKKGVSFKELLADKNKNETETEIETRTVTNGQDAIVEKTLYVDIVTVVKSPKEGTLPTSTLPESSVNEGLDSDMWADCSKHDLKSKMHASSWNDSEFNVDEFDDPKLKAYQKKLFELYAPPPLPQSPSDSWLCRTLPSVSSKQTPPAKWNSKEDLSSYTLATEQDTRRNESQSPQGPLDTIPEI